MPTSPDESVTSPYLTPAQAAEYLQLTTGTLANMRVRGGGPAFRKHGRRVVYARADLDQWSEQRRAEAT